MPSLVNYVGQGYLYKNLGYEYEGSMLVLKKYLSTEYLWNNVRVMGGAYGSFIQIDKYGNLGLVSYRDPNVKRTDVYKRQTSGSTVVFIVNPLLRINVDASSFE